MSFQIHIGPNIRTSPYFEATVAEGVQSFSVYNHMYIPGSFGDPEAEYDRLINGVAMWDVAAQRQVEVAGPDAGRLVQWLSTRDVSAMQVGQGRYVCLCDRRGLLINDPVLLKLDAERYWFSIADSDIALWAEAFCQAQGLDAVVTEPDASPLAVQGPKAEDVVADLFGDWVRGLRYFWFREAELEGIPLLLARSGWSKQGGFELYLRDASRGGDLWALVREAGRPHGIGPGAPNDCERIESALISYGADMRRQTVPADPFEMGLGKLVDLDRPISFVGREALARIAREGPARRRTGVFLDGPPIVPNREPLPIRRGAATVGILSEAAHSPRLGRNIGLALVESGLPGDATGLSIHHDGADWPLTLTDLPFLRGR